MAHAQNRVVVFEHLTGFEEQICRGWYYDEYSDCIMDDLHCPEGVDSIVWKYTPDADYHA